MEILFELVGELIVQIIAEVLAEFGLHSLAAPFRRKANPWLTAAGYVLLGIAGGALSLLVVANQITPDGIARLANLAIAPLLAGFGMVMLGRWRAKRGDPRLGIDRFLYGYLFALSFALVRFVFAA